MDQDTTRQSNGGPRLLEIANDGQALKPEELAGQPITILDDIEVETRDGRASHQWVVRTDDGRTRIFWSAGKGPTAAVKLWFRENPRVALRCQLDRSQDQWGNNVWHIRQVMEDGSVSPSEAGQSALDAQLAEVGL